MHYAGAHLWKENNFYVLSKYTEQLKKKRLWSLSFKKLAVMYENEITGKYYFLFCASQYFPDFLQ
jgi:hypothetical protein